MKQIFSYFLVILLLFAGIGSSIVYADDTRIITDMMGRSVSIPSDINSVLCGSPPSFTLTYAIAPEKLAGQTINLNKKYAPDAYAGLPVVGTIGTGANFETFLDINPDVVLMSNYPVYADESAAREAIVTLQEKLEPIPVVFIKEATNITEYSDSIRYIGDLLGEEEQADAMITFYEDVLDTVQGQVASIPEDNRVRVYYAGGDNGLSTTPAGSDFSLLIELCGGINVADFAQRSGKATQDVSMEQILTWNPDVILALQPEFYEQITADPAWQDISAVRNGRVYLIPKSTFNWFTQPPGINRIIGIPWVAKTLYPESFEDMDLEALIKEFHELYFHISLSDDQIREILNP